MDTPSVTPGVPSRPLTQDQRIGMGPSGPGILIATGPRVPGTQPQWTTTVQVYVPATLFSRLTLALPEAFVGTSARPVQLMVEAVPPSTCECTVTVMSVSGRFWNATGVALAHVPAVVTDATFVSAPAGT